MLTISLLLYLFLSIVISAVVFERINLGRIIITFFLTVYASNILIFELLSLLGIIDQKWIFLILQTVLCALLVVLLIQKKQFSISLLKEKVASFLEGWRWIDYVLLGFICLILGAFFKIGITTPPNNMDTLHTHLTRIYYWLQHGSFAYWNASSSSHLNYPINGHIQGLWLFLLGRNENLFFLVQWFSLIVVLAAIYEIARSLNFPPTQAMFSATLACSFPVLLLQTYSFQGDLTVAALGMACLSLLITSYLTRKLQYFYCAILALILAVGTKQTAFFIAPVIGVYVLVLLWKNRKQIKILPIIGICALMFLVFASYQYVQNFVNTGSVFGVDDALGSDYVDTSNLGKKAVYVLPRYFYQFIGVDAVPRYMQPALLEAKAKVFKNVLSPLGINLEEPVFLQAGASDDEQFYYEIPPILSEDNAWFGPLAFPLVMIAVLIALFCKNKLNRQYTIFAILLNCVYVFLIFLQRPGWDPYQGRYFMLGFLPLVPLSGILIPNLRGWKYIPLVLIVPLVMFLAFNTNFTNIYKPTLNANNIYGFQYKYILTLPEKTRVQIITKNYLVKISNRIGDAGDSRRSILTLNYLEQLFTGSKVIGIDIAFVDEHIAAGTPIYFTSERSSMEYGLFGRNKTRDIYPVDHIDEVPSGYYLASRKIVVATSEKIQMIAKNENYAIYYVNP